MTRANVRLFPLRLKIRLVLYFEPIKESVGRLEVLPQGILTWQRRLWRREYIDRDWTSSIDLCGSSSLSRVGCRFTSSLCVRVSTE